MSDPPKRNRYWLHFGLHVLLVGAMLYYTVGNAGVRFVIAWTLSIALGMAALQHFVSAMAYLFIAAIAQNSAFPRSPEIDETVKRFGYAVVPGFLWSFGFVALSFAAAWLLFPR